MKGTVLGFYSMLLGCAATYGQQDITSFYLVNPSFEEYTEHSGGKPRC